MSTGRSSKPRVFVDADVLFAGAAAPSQHGASLVVLRMAEITLIQAITSHQVVTEAERNLAAKLPRALPAFRLLVERCLQVTPDPLAGELTAYGGLAHPKDLPILVAALRAECAWLTSFNLDHYRPGELVLRVRDRLAHLAGGRS